MNELEKRSFCSFVGLNDVTNEFNTPITIATGQLLSNGCCNDKTLRNISVSTRQLYDIYRSRAYLNFSRKKSEPLAIDLANLYQLYIQKVFHLEQPGESAKHRAENGIRSKQHGLTSKIAVKRQSGGNVPY